jgi:hypothetical protein
MDWLSLALLLLRIADKIADWLRERGQMDAGRDRALAEQAAAILAKTSVAKAVLQDVTGMTSEQVDARLKWLEL